MKRTAAASFTSFATSRGVTFTPAQSVAFRVLFDGVEPADLEGTDAELGRTLFGAADTLPPLARETVVIVKGARIGGSRFSALRALHLALTSDLSTLAPGEERKEVVQLRGYQGGEMNLTAKAMSTDCAPVTSTAKTRQHLKIILTFLCTFDRVALC